MSSGEKPQKFFQINLINQYLLGIVQKNRFKFQERLIDANIKTKLDEIARKSVPILKPHVFWLNLGATVSHV